MSFTKQQTPSIMSTSNLDGHPRHTKIKIPLNLARRIRAIVSANDKEKLTKRMNHLTTCFKTKNTRQIL